MVSSRTGSAYKYTRTDGSKICDTYTLQKDLAVHVEMHNQAA